MSVCMHPRPHPLRSQQASLIVEYPVKLVESLHTMDPVCTLPERDGKQTRRGAELNRRDEFVVTHGGGRAMTGMSMRGDDR